MVVCVNATFTQVLILEQASTSGSAQEAEIDDQEEQVHDCFSQGKRLKRYQGY